MIAQSEVVTQAQCDLFRDLPYGRDEKAVGSYVAGGKWLKKWGTLKCTGGELKVIKVPRPPRYYASFPSNVPVNVEIADEAIKIPLRKVRMVTCQMTDTAIY